MKRLLIAASLILAWTGAALAAGPVVIDFDEANPPFMFADGGAAKGVYPLLIGEAFKRMGEPATLNTCPWKRCIGEIDAGKAMVGGIYQNAERLAKYDYSKALFQEELVLFARADHPVTFNSVADLKDKHIGVIRGWSYTDEFDHARQNHLFTADEVASDQQNLQKLANGRLDAFVAIRQAGQALVAKAGLTGKVVVLAKPIATNPTYLAAGKSANQSAILAKFDQAVAAMHQDGSFDKLVAQAFGQ